MSLLWTVGNLTLAVGFVVALVATVLAHRRPWLPLVLGFGYFATWLYAIVALHGGLR